MALQGLTHVRVTADLASVAGARHAARDDWREGCGQLVRAPTLATAA